MQKKAKSNQRSQANQTITNSPGAEDIRKKYAELRATEAKAVLDSLLAQLTEKKCHLAIYGRVGPVEAPLTNLVKFDVFWRIEPHE